MCRETGVEEEGEEGEGENQSAWIGLREGGRRDGLEGESSWKEGGRGWDTDRWGWVGRFDWVDVEGKRSGLEDVAGWCVDEDVEGDAAGERKIDERREERVE
jgi:hypothetical protein